MTEKVSLENATVNILIELNGKVNMVAMKKDKYDAISMLSKVSAETLIDTGKTQAELLRFLNYKEDSN